MASKVTLDGKLMFPKDYIAAVELQGRDWTLTITGVQREDLVMQGGAKKNKPVLTFAETKKKLVVNSTNADSIATMYGGEARTWIGKRITVFPTKTTCGRDTVDCIRVREKKQEPPDPAPQQPPRQPDPKEIAQDNPPASLLEGQPQIPW